MREDRGDLGVVVRRRDLDDVHPDEVDLADDLAHRPQQLAREHAARLGRAGRGRHAGVDDVDVDAQVDAVGAVERLRDRVGDHRLAAPLLDLDHRVPPHALLAHPVEGLRFGPVATEPDLHEVRSGDPTLLDQAAHRLAVAVQVAPLSAPVSACASKCTSRPSAANVPRDGRRARDTSSSGRRRARSGRTGARHPVNLLVVTRSPRSNRVGTIGASPASTTVRFA